MKNLAITCCLLIILASCSLFNSGDDHDEIKRTYPHAFAYEHATVSQLKDSLSPPDSVNVYAYVVGLTFCGPHQYCLLPNGIFLSEYADSAGSENNLFLQLQESRKFEKGQRYEMSIGLSTYPGNGQKYFYLLGYSLIENEK